MPIDLVVVVVVDVVDVVVVDVDAVVDVDENVTLFGFSSQI
jgi:hypothetical protein